MLVSTSQASEVLGISLQGVHYRIKKGLLKSKKQDGKTFVYLDKNLQKQNAEQISSYDDIIKAKNEQIKLLDNSMEWMKDQYKSEIQRLSDTQDKMMDVFKSEIDLLKQAYNEMNNLHKLVDKSKNTNLKEEFEEQIKENILDNDTISLKEFFTQMKKFSKTNEQIKEILVKQIKEKDERFTYDKKTKEVYIRNADFFDLL